MSEIPTRHICPDCFYTWEHGRDGSHSCIQQLRRYRLPADVRLPGGMTIARGCELNTVLLALRHREAGETWQTSFDEPIPVDGQLQRMIRALPTQPLRETSPGYMAGAPLLSTAAQDVGRPVCGICDGKGSIAYEDQERRARSGGNWGRCLNCRPYAAHDKQSGE